MELEASERVCKSFSPSSVTVSDYVLPHMRPFLDQLWRCSNIAMNIQEAKIFVGGVNWSTSEETLRSDVENFGSVQEAFVSYDRHTGRPRGFGFVVFEDPLVADKVVSIQHTIDRREVPLCTVSGPACEPYPGQQL